MSAKKFLALAMTAFKAKQYEDAGVLFAQASGAEGADALIAELTTEPGEIRLDGEVNPDANAVTKDGLVEDGEEADVEQTDVENDPKDGKVSETGPDAELAATPGRDQAVDSTSSGEDDWGTEDGGEPDTISVSSITRRKTTSLFQIGKILSASMQALASEDTAYEGDDEDDEDGDEDEHQDLGLDPDYPGQELVPVSFSSVRIKNTEVKSPVVMKD